MTVLRSVFAAVLCASVLFVAGCDGGGAGTSTNLEGTFTAQRFTFETTGTAIADFNLLADTLAAAPQMRFFSGNGAVFIDYRLEGQTGSFSIAGSFVRRDSRIIVDLSTVNSETLQDLLLPETLRLTLLADENTLTADQQVDNVELASYAPGRYGGLTQPVNGTLRLTFTRTSDTAQ
ncbi:hypothetical protein [Salisaeta longa]|uniref:hypothetical protein n=1 Tax=Salisaeta longa TaxID=503170 RepID=UPI0003B42547|nr:hypothetical protein [Salisaeta longa]